MKEETHDINEIIIRYLDGSAELEEKRLLLRWLKQSDDNRDDFIATRDLWLSCNVAAGNELEIDIALGKLKNRILLEQGRMERVSLEPFYKISQDIKYHVISYLSLSFINLNIS